uniref:Nucleolar protein 6 n=1 Tax=Clastoptera arizonana TaxID=38151 RepID=A0A1B6D0E1_9HEMI
MPVEINAMEDNLDGSSLEEDVLKSKSDNSEECDDLPDDDDEFSDDDEKNNVFENLQSIESKKRKHKMEERSIENILDESQRSRKRKKEGHVSILPPTAEEMTRLRESENLFHSNLFRLQIEEIIKEVKPKQSERKSIKQWLEKFVKFLMNVDESTLLTVESLEDYQVPFCELPKKLKIDFDFLKPASVDVQGSYKAGCCLGPSLVVDVFVTMPRQCLSKTDRFNGLYHFKRAMYLAYLTKLLDGNELLDNDKGLEYCNKFGDPLKSVLLIHPMGRLRRVGVFLHVIPEEGSFKLINLSPDKNNVKTSWWIENTEPAVETPTPHYNNSILEDMVVSKNETLRSEILEGNQNLKDAITLLRVWLRQRQLDKVV